VAANVWALTGARVVGPTGIEASDVVVADGRIIAVGVGAAAEVTERVDLDGAYLAPGLVDLQINGGWGIDLAREPDRVWELAEHLAHDGVTSFCPTLVSCPDDTRARFLDVLRAGPPRDNRSRARSLGAHLEGPILNPVRRGAHPTNALRPADLALVASWDRSEVAYVTLAPELPGAHDVVRALVARGVRVSAGHTDASVAQLLAAEAAGVGWVTHLFNAMAPFNHRSPGPIGAVLGAASSLGAGLIADGVHVDPIAVALAWKALGPERLFLVTDAVSPMGVVARGDEIRLADGTLAGANLHLADAMVNFRRFTGCSTYEAITVATRSPADRIGDEIIGRIAPGCRSDFVVLDDDLRVLRTVVGGEFVTDRS
jgi:N-acetylglucosamine-6-phosphate deacetylase